MVEEQALKGRPALGAGIKKQFIDIRKGWIAYVSDKLGILISEAKPIWSVEWTFHGGEE